MIKDLLDNFVKELQHEKNQENLSIAIEPYIYKIRIYFYIIFLMLFIMTINLSFIVFKMYR